MVDVFCTFQLDVLPFPVKKYPLEIYTRAMPGSSLVTYMRVFWFVVFLLASQILKNRKQWAPPQKLQAMLLLLVLVLH